MQTPGIATLNSVAKKVVLRTDSVLNQKSVRDSLVSLAGLVGCQVKDKDGKSLGRLVDIVVRSGEHSYPPVSGLIVKVGNRRAWIDGARIARFKPNEIRLSSLKVNLAEFERRDGEALLDGDVLDHQIVDVDGLRVVRSSDLYLARFENEIRLIAVDISFMTFMRRLAPGHLGRRPTPTHVLDWASVASLSAGGQVKTAASRHALSQLRPADLADILEDLSGREQSALIELLDPELAADALEEMEDDELQGLMRGLPDEQAAELLSHMEPDESAELLRDLADEHREEILQAMDDEQAEDLRELAAYSEDVAGGVMTTHMLVFTKEQKVGAALKALVANRERDVSDGVLVVDQDGKLIDHIQVMELLAGKSTQLLEELIGAPFPTAVYVETPIEAVVEEFCNNRGSSIVVVDRDSKPVGRILADDLVDALRPEDPHRSSAGTGVMS
jgi:sporulation protein YlmC with PRC-barrel domain